jgi:membrane-associated protease RseP (regulator of RpoE activity)
MNNYVLILLIVTAYILIFNSALFIFAKKFGVKVEKFFVWHDPWFALFSKKIGETEFGIGWLPLGGYLKLTGMDLEDDYVPKPHDFSYLSQIKQAITLFSGPLAMLLLGINGLYSNLNGESLTKIALHIIGVLAVYFLFILIAPKIFKNKTLDASQQLITFILVLLLYLMLFFLLLKGVNDVIPFLSHIRSFLETGHSFKNMISTLTYHQKVIFTTYFGFLFSFMNLIPLGGMNGFLLLQCLYHSLVGRKFPEKLAEKYATISFFIALIAFAYLFFKFIF